MWEIDFVYPDPLLPLDGRRRNNALCTESAFIVTAHTPIASFLAHIPSLLSCFRQGGKAASVALADYASRYFLESQQSQKTTKLEKKNDDANDRHGFDITFCMEVLDEILLSSRQRKRATHRLYHPYIVERSDFFCVDDKFHVTVRTFVGTESEEHVSEEEFSSIVSDLAPKLLQSVFPVDDIDFTKKLMEHVACVVLQQNLRSYLSSMNAIAFIADGSILPRRSGASATPMASPPAVPFKAPVDSSMTTSVSVDMGALAAYITSPLDCVAKNTVTLTGLVVPAGITLICGGGYHGKSTLLQAISVGHYDKIPGDGRELCVSITDALSVRAEDGRYVNNCNISAFISNLPTPPGVNSAMDTEHFSSRDSSGSTSQAANVAEAIEFGAKALLVDEDISAANFMARDGRMRALVMDESITPLLYRVNGLYSTHNISSVVVVGGVGDWLDVPHNVILLDKYIVFDATAKAKSISRQFSYGHVEYAGRGVVHRLQWENKGTPKLRRPLDSFSERFNSDVVVSLLDGGRALSLYKEGADDSPTDSAKSPAQFSIDDEEEEGCVEASRLEQLLGKKQLFACGICVVWILQNAPKYPEHGLKELLELLDSNLEREGMNRVVKDLQETEEPMPSKSRIQILESVGYVERPRSFEVGQTLTRMYGIQFEDIPMEDDEEEETARREEERRKKALADLWAKRRSK